MFKILFGSKDLSEMNFMLFIFVSKKFIIKGIIKQLNS
mgnify:CR=1 FL=1